MRVHFERSGGLGGEQITATVDSESLPAGQAARLRDLVNPAGFFDLPAVIAAPGPAADVFTFTLTVEHTVRIDEQAVPAAFRALLDLLTEAAAPARPCECGDWQAVHDREPGAEPTLRVTGVCTCPTPGYTIALRRHEPQGVNRRILLLDLVVAEPQRPAPRVLDDVAVEYTEATDAPYDQVTILPEGVTVDVTRAV